MQKSFGANESDRQTEMQSWLSMVESLMYAPEWSPDDLPIEMVQTHISIVLLGQHHVLKLKKPVDFGFLDYTTLENRRRACAAEVDLNRRLCPDIYLAVQPVTEVDGETHLSSEGRVVDYGVWMKRLPADRMLDRMVADGRVTEAMIDRVAGRLSRFHRQARRGPEVYAYGRPDAIRRNWEENFTQTAPYVGRTITPQAYNAIRAWVTRWMINSDELLRTRVRDGRICDGHGDLRCESICVTDGICIFDCIEFNDRFRCGDVASEVAFLEMDLYVRGRPDLGYYFRECYQRRTDDRELFSLMPFYRCYRAYVRGKVLSFRLDEPEFGEEERRAAATRATNYFKLARRYAAPLDRPTMIAVMGLSGTGKTSVARSIAAELGLRVVSSDAVRKDLFNHAAHQEGYGEGIYGPEANRLTYQALLDRASNLLKEDGGVVIDATFQRADDRRRARELASTLGAEWRLIECQLTPDLLKARLANRDIRGNGLSDAIWETYLRQRERFEPATESTDVTHLLIDNSGSLPSVSQTATDWLRANEGNQFNPRLSGGDYS
jgi:aminoglycoside phosphotransferase family enzyme/predicted kinase